MIKVITSERKFRLCEAFLLEHNISLIFHQDAAPAPREVVIFNNVDGDDLFDLLSSVMGGGDKPITHTYLFDEADRDAAMLFKLAFA